MRTLVSRRTRITEKFSLTVTGKELNELISQELAANGQPRLPYDAYIYVSIPGGGDWSNSELDISEHPLEITWTVERGDDE